MIIGSDARNLVWVDYPKSYKGWESKMDRRRENGEPAVPSLAPGGNTDADIKQGSTDTNVFFSPMSGTPRSGSSPSFHETGTLDRDVAVFLSASSVAHPIKQAAHLAPIDGFSPRSCALQSQGTLSVQGSRSRNAEEDSLVPRDSNVSGSSMERRVATAIIANKVLPIGIPSDLLIASPVQKENDSQATVRDSDQAFPPSPNPSVPQKRRISIGHADLKGSADRQLLSVLSATAEGRPPPLNQSRPASTGRRSLIYIPIKILLIAVVAHILIIAFSSVYYSLGSGFIPMTPLNTTYPFNVYGFCLCCVFIGAVIPLSATLWIRTLMDVDTSFFSFREAWLPSVAYSLIIIVYFGLGMAKAWPDSTVMLPLWTGGAFYLPSVGVATWLCLPRDVKQEEGSRRRFLHACGVPAVMNGLWFCLCAFYIAMSYFNKYFAIQCAALLGTRVVVFACTLVRSHLVSKAVTKMTLRQQARLSALAAFEIEAMADIYLGMATPRVNWYLWGAVSVVQNVSLCMRILESMKWLQWKLSALTEPKHGDKSVLVENNVTLYVLDIVSKFYRTIFVCITIPMLYYSPNAVYFPFTPEYSRYYYGSSPTRFTIEARDLEAAMVLSGLSLVPIMLNSIWGKWYMENRLKRSLLETTMRILWMPALNAFVPKGLGSLSDLSVPMEKAGASGNIATHSTLSRAFNGTGHGPAEPKAYPSQAIPLRPKGSLQVSTGEVACSRFSLRATDSAYWKILFCIYLIIPVHPLSQLGRPWSVITYINDQILRSAF